ncbi:hypothetical protein LEN26_003163 [Aphanomyces euteiches]|nr:hypothetical protein LEN26_003163 [Aphanomyces euteiches]
MTPAPTEEKPSKRRGRTVKDEEDDDPDQKRPRGRPRKSDKPSATWCNQSVRLLFQLRFDTELRKKFDERDNRAKRAGYEMLASKLSEQMSRKYDNAQVQQKLSQLHTVWTKYKPQEDESATNRPAYYDLMVKYWGDQSIHQQGAKVAKKELTNPPVPAALPTPLGVGLIGRPPTVAAVSTTPTGTQTKLRRILSKQIEADEAIPAATSVPPMSTETPARSQTPPAIPLGTAFPAQASQRGSSDFDNLAAALKDGIVAFSNSFVRSSTSLAASASRDDKIDAMIESNTKLAAKIDKLISVLSSRYNVD